MGFQVKKAVREKIKVKVALMAPSGGGKTYSALRLATGMAEEIKKETGKKAKILMGNTEQKRGYYYANEFDYDIVDIEPPHIPEKYVELVDFAVENGYDILIIDSTTHEWEGQGGCLDIVNQYGGKYQDWAKVTPRHQKFIDAIAESPIHIIATMRGKDQYETTKDEKTGKMSVQKLGVGARQRDGFEYEFTVTFLIDQKTNSAEVQKDNSHLFENQGPTILTEKHGVQLMQWANSGEEHQPTLEEKLEPLQKSITEIAVAKGGSQNADVVAVLQKYSIVNPKDCLDEKILKSALKELEKIKVENKEK